MPGGVAGAAAIIAAPPCGLAKEASLGQEGNPHPSKSCVIQKLTGLTCDLECPVIDAMKFFLIQQGAVCKKAYFLGCGSAVGVCAQPLPWLGLVARRCSADHRARRALASG
jgi:hypothetical protein